MMKNTIYRIKELSDLNNLAAKFDPIKIGFTGSTSKSSIAETVFGKSIRQINSFCSLWINNPKEFIDVSSLAGISRSIIEAYNVYQYFCEYGLSKEEFEFRIILMSYHHSSDLVKILDQLGFDSKDIILSEFTVLSILLCEIVI